MRPLSYRSDELRSLLMRTKIATLDELKQALGTSVDVTVFRKIKPLDYLTSYSHRGRYYTLREIARFDEKGLWSHATVWFSQLGTLPSTAESFVNRSPRGYFADELAGALHVDVQDALHQLAQQRRITRQMGSGLYLYTAIGRTIQIVCSSDLFRRRTCRRLACRCAGRIASTGATTPDYPPDGFGFVFVYGHRSHNPDRVLFRSISPTNLPAPCMSMCRTHCINWRNNAGLPARWFRVCICIRPSVAQSSKASFLRAAMWILFPRLRMPPCWKSQRKN